MKVKICGITNLEDALLCERLGADALGFIFHRKSKRYVTPETAREITSQLSFFTWKVGVFVDTPADEINHVSRCCRLSAVQLHGDESPDLAALIDRPVIKAFRILEGFDFTRPEAFKHCSWLLDTYSDKSPGGTGRTFNWEIIPESMRKTIILAGGISIKNIREVFGTISPAAVDVSSALEEIPGKKDRGKVETFMKLVRELNTR